MDKMPIQPTYIDEHGVKRFRANAVIDWMFESGMMNLNRLVIDMQLNPERFPPDHIAQFYQLLGYSHSGFGELNLVTDEEYERATESTGDTR